MPVEGSFVPICIRAGALGQHDELLVSPLHRILIRDDLAELLFGEVEVLVAARDLLNDQSILRRPGGEMTCFHLLFDRHQVIYSAELETESFLPGPQTACGFESALLEELYTILPELDPRRGSAYPEAARRTLRRFEARAWIAARAA